ncbi:hypothetical protein Q3G72_024902 [Acer saccharum]|nr:hypothetical protein Q3G72_024902 [Acer saccharum]
MFYGEIPSDICKLSSLHILDLAENNLSGSIPSCLGNLSGMASDVADRYEGQLPVATKGTEYLYTETLSLVNSIDLSINNLSGKLLKQEADQKTVLAQVSSRSNPLLHKSILATVFNRRS